MRRGFRGNTVRLKHVKTIRKANGKVYRYFVAPDRPMVRLPDLPPDSPGFLAAYAEAAKEARKPAPGALYPAGSIGAACAAYEASDAFLRLAKATRDMRRRILYRIMSSYGQAALKDLAPRHIEKDLSAFPPHPANNRLKAWRAFCAWAKDAGLIQSDPAKDLSPRRAPKSDGHEQWTRDDLDQARAAWPYGTRQRLALELLQWVGCRIADAVRLGPGMVDKAGWLTFRQHKTGGEVAIPFRRALPAFAAGMQADLDHLHRALDEMPDRHMTWLVTEAGAARSERAATQWVAAAARRAGLTGKTAHGLRKYRAAMLAEAGATDHQIGAWTGHESPSEIRRYTRKADKRRILSGETGNEIGNPVSSVSAKS